MSFERWETFVKFAHSSIRIYYDNPAHNIGTYSARLTDLASEVMGEKRKNLSDESLSSGDMTLYLETMITKIDLLYSNLFEEREGIRRYIPDGISVNDENDLNLSARLLHDNICRLHRIFRSSLLSLPRLASAPSTAANKRKRVPLRESFETARPINLRAVHRILTDRNHPFIDTSTTYSDFAAVFTGDPVRRKVSWLALNALHYFISGIHGVGINRANEGQWVRASRCFTVNGRDFTPSQIKDAGDPVASVTELLDRAIRLFL